MANDNSPEKEEKEIEQPKSDLTFSDSEIKIEIPASKESRQEDSHRDGKGFSIDIGNFSEKFIANKKVLIYGLLILIIILSMYVRTIGANSQELAPGDGWWHYRHAKEIYEHGYPGTAIKPLSPEERSVCWREPACTFDRKGVYWDYLHDAPEGGAAPIELYQYFSAYSYKYFTKFFFPNLLEWMSFNTVLLSGLTVLVIFFLAKEFFDEKAG